MDITEFEIEFDPTVGQEFEIDIEDFVTEVFPDLVNLEVTPTEEEQIFNHDGEYGYDEVKVNPIPEDYIIPSGELDIDRNGKHNIREYESVNVLVEPVLQTKIVTPTKNIQVVRPDNEYYGLDEVNVNPIPDKYIVPSGTLNITENGTKDVTNYANVNVNMETKEDLEEELNTYNNELVNQDINISDIMGALQGKAINQNNKIQYIQSLQAGTVIGKAPYYLNYANVNRGSYIGFDIIITPGKTYRLIGNKNYTYRILQITEETAIAMKNNEDVPDEMFIANSDYISNDFTFEAVDNAKYLWITCRLTRNVEEKVALLQAGSIYIEEVEV